MNEFAEIRERVDIKSIAELYGLEVNRSGMCNCPFHNEKTPSMKLYERDNKFYCFGCGKSGDGIDLCAGITGLSSKDAAKELDKAYGLGLYNSDRQENKEYVSNTAIQKQKERAERQAEEQWLRNAFIIVREYKNTLGKFEKIYRPNNPESPHSPFFVEALTKKASVELLLENLNDNGHEVYMHSKHEVENVAKRLREIRQLGLDKIKPLKQEKKIEHKTVSEGHIHRKIKI